MKQYVWYFEHENKLEVFDSYDHDLMMNDSRLFELVLKRYCKGFSATCLGEL